jgi:L-ascorbate metabolism protein UlaG (beta-lactamase superfamily)
MRRILVLLLSLAVAACAALDYRSRYHDGPVSDHFDGTRFFIPGREIGKGLLDVIRWRLEAQTVAWPEEVPLDATARPAARVHGSELVVTFVGHATVLVQTAGLNLLTDPTWAERASPVSWAGPRRVTPPGIAFEDLPPIDAVLVSHNHYDHMDLPTLRRLHEAHAPLFVVPLGNEGFLRDAAADMRVVTLDWWQAVPLDKVVKVHAVPVYHWSRRTAFDRNKALWSGFVVTTPHGGIYYGGDTGLGDEAFFRETRARFGAFRLALLPVGAYEPRWFMQGQHVNPAEAVRVHTLLGAGTSVGVHLRTFQLTDEGIDQPEMELAAALAAAGIDPARFRTLPIGGTLRAP